jgi:hypothetical protein
MVLKPPDGTLFPTAWRIFCTPAQREPRFSFRSSPGIVMHGYHVGEFLGKPPAGKECAAKLIQIWRLKDGDAIEHWSVRDDLRQALQLRTIRA